ncbi:MAG: hypothetical protein ACI9UV_001669 [Algoriphagus sp.]|jgi:hypothetical protein
MKRLLIFFFALVCLFQTSTTFAQISEFEGYVLDRKTMLPIPFATIQVQGQLQNGIVTDLRGWFRLQNVTEDAILIVSHVGYEKKEFAITSISYTKELFLTPLTYQLSEV